MVRREHRKLAGQALDRLEHELGPSHSSTENAAPFASPGQPTSRSGGTVMISVIPRVSR